MTGPAEGSTSASPELEEAAQLGLLSQLKVMRRALMGSRAGKPIVGLCILIFIVVAVTAYGQIRLNQWNKPFYDALSRRDFSDFLYQLGIFFIIAGALLVLNAAHPWLGET